MWKFVAAISAWLCLYGAAHAHVLPVLLPEIGSLRDAVRQVALGTLGGRQATPQIACNIVTGTASVSGPCASPVATCNGDKITVTRTTSITSGTKNLVVTVNTFSSGDVGKAIVIPGAGNSGGTYFGNITVFVDAQHVTLNNNATTTLSSVSTTFSYGTNDAPSFASFNTWARANQGSTNQVVLTVPNGSSCWFGDINFGLITVANPFAAGIRSLIVEGAGATLDSVGGGGFWLGGLGQCQVGISQANGCSARIQTVSAGSGTVTLTAASLASGYVSRFTTNKWILIGGLNPQATWLVPQGFPVNLRYFEWRQITNVNAGTGVITLDRPLTNSYLSTWPLYTDGNCCEADQGGPATIWTVDDTWNASAEYRGMTISQAGQTYGQIRNLTYRNSAFTGGHGAIPTQNETWSCYSCDYTGTNMETDKLVGAMLMDTVTISEIKFQSSSTDLFIGRNLTVTTDITGSATNVDISDSTLASWAPGSYAYGATTGYTKCTRCAVASFSFDSGGIFQNRPSDYSMSSGVISFANTNASSSDPDERIFVPGGNIYYAASGYLTVGLFQAQAITQDPTNTFIQTNEAGGFPALAGVGAFRTHPAPQFTCDSCTGDAKLVATNIQSGATALAPLGQYSFRSFAPTSAQGNLGDLVARGKIVSLTIDVTQAYSGAGTAVLHTTSQFDNMVTVKQSNWTNFAWGPQINLKQTGTRVITPSGVTCNGVAAPTGCSGDSLGTALPEAVWIQDKISPFMGSTLSAGTQPLFTMTLRTDQGVVP